MSTIKRRLLQLAVFVAALIILIALLAKVGWGEIGAALARIGGAAALLILTLSFSEHLFDTFALRSAVTGPISFFRVTCVSSAGALLNLILPWELGEVAKATLMRHTRGGVAAVVTWNYVFKLSRPIVGLLAALTGMALTTEVDATVAHVVVAASLLGFLPYIGLRVIVRHGVAAFFLRTLGDRLRWPKRETIDGLLQIDRVVRQMWAERPGAYLRVLFAQMGARCASWATLYAVIHALGLGYSFGLVSLLYAGLNVAEFVVAVLPARLGVAEGTAFMLFGVAGLPQEAAILIYVVQRLKSIATHALLAPFARVGRP